MTISNLWLTSLANTTGVPDYTGGDGWTKLPGGAILLWQAYSGTGTKTWHREFSQDDVMVWPSFAGTAVAAANKQVVTLAGSGHGYLLAIGR